MTDKMDIFDRVSLPLHRLERLLVRLDCFTEELDGDAVGLDMLGDLMAYVHALDLQTAELRRELEAACDQRRKTQDDEGGSHV